MLSKHISFVKKSNFLSSVKEVYNYCSIDYLIALRDAISLLISSKQGTGDNYDRVIEQSTGVIRIWTY